MRKKIIDHRDFVRDLKRGVQGEKMVERFLKEEFGLLTTNLSDKNPDFDLVIDGVCPDLAEAEEVVPKRLFEKILRDSFGITKRKHITVEVKTDVAAAKYRNFFVELFFNIDDGVPGTTFKCKADLLIWVVPDEKRKKTTVYIFKRPEFLAFIFEYVFANKNLKMRAPGISPYARGLPIPIKVLANSYACIGEFVY